MTGFQVPQCTHCNHAEGDHASGGAGWPHPPQRGVCLVPGCPCVQYRQDTTRKAAA